MKASWKRWKEKVSKAAYATLCFYLTQMKTKRGRKKIPMENIC